MCSHISISKKRGFSLIEVLVATFIFALAMSAVSQIFVSAFSAYHREKVIQNNLENAQFALNTLTKQLRGSSASSNIFSGVDSYNYATGLCTRYFISTIFGVTALRSISLTVNGTNNGCTNVTQGSLKEIVRLASGYISVTSSLPDRVGKVTISLHISDSGQFPAHLQTTVSLRDYEVSGL